METDTKGSYIYLQLPVMSAVASSLDRELAFRLIQIFGSRMVGNAVDLYADFFKAERLSNIQNVRTFDGFINVSRFLDNFFFSKKYRSEDKYKSIYNLAFRRVEIIHMPNVFGITGENFFEFSQYIDEKNIDEKTLVRNLKNKMLSSEVIYNLFENDSDREEILERFPLQYEILKTF